MPNNLTQFNRGSNRCPHCRVLLDFCYCAFLKKVETDTSVDIIMHHREKRLASNTANLALLTIPKARVHLRGMPDQVFDVESIFLKDHIPLYLFPLDHSVPLTQNYVQELRTRDPRPIQLIAPDGSWSQARRVIEREKALQKIPCVSMRGLPPSTYRLRKEHFSDGMATFEAIAHALSVIEGPEKIAVLFQNFEVMVEQNLKTRGLFRYDKNTRGPSIGRK